MKPMALLLLVLALWATSESRLEAQVGYVTYYQPAPAFLPPVTVYRPGAVYYSSYYVPAMAAPAMVAPAMAAPAPAVIAAPAVVGAYQPVTQVRTRYRPILGGTVTRVRHGYAPAYYVPAPIVYAY